MRTEQELRDGVLETLKCLISCRENMPGWSLDEVFSKEAIQEIMEEFEYLKNLWANDCRVEKKATPTPEWLEKQFDIVEKTTSEWSGEKQKRFLEEVSSLAEYKLEKQREEIRESLRNLVFNLQS